eukprot:TRINITY_DN29378_c0_g1_i1.p2 TRINITY_DN29378_c0_g1~~TRINITY_DN29378_c0_g1_i1.p2  ORF type:complete len:167 (+),score=46.10 TRINITY_DN29378_c0_g1_i1:214-714(+)
MIDVFLLPLEQDLVELFKDTTKKWSEASEATDPSKRLENIGQPYHHTWHTMLEWALGSEKATEMDKTDIKEYSVQVESLLSSPETRHKVIYTLMEEHVGYCRIVKCHDKAKKRLEVSVMPGSPAAKPWAAVIRILSATTGVSRRPGMAPPSELEQRVQQLIEKLSK